MLGVLERDEGKMPAGGVVVARDVLEPPDLERDLDGVRPSRKRLQIQVAGFRKPLFVPGQGPLRPPLAGVLLLGGAVKHGLVARKHGAPGGLLQPAAWRFRGQILLYHCLVLLGGFRLEATRVQELAIEEAEIVSVRCVGEEAEVFRVQSARREPCFLQVGLARLVVDLHRQVAQGLLTQASRLLVSFVGDRHAARRRSFAHALEDLDQPLRLGQKIPPPASALGEDEEPGLIQRRRGHLSVDGKELAVDDLRLGVAPGVEQELAILLEHLQAVLSAELLRELVLRRLGLADPRVRQHVVPPRFAGQLDLVQVSRLLGDVGHPFEKLHRVGKRALVEPAPGGLVERVGVHVVVRNLRGGAVLLQRGVELRRIEQVLADEDMARRRPDRAREPLRQLTRYRDGFGIAPRFLQGVGEEEQRLVRSRRAGVLLQQLAVAGDGLRACIRGSAPILRGGRLVTAVGRCLGADGERQAARAQEARETCERLGLTGRRAAQLQHPPQRRFLLLLLHGGDRRRAPVQQRRIAARLRHCRGDEQGKHQQPSLPAARGQPPAVLSRRCNLRSLRPSLSGWGNGNGMVGKSGSQFPGVPATFAGVGADCEAVGMGARARRHRWPS